MTDFIDALEEQLVAAHRDRRRWRFVVPWRGGAVLVAAAVAAAAVVALVVVLASPDAHRPATKPPAHDVAIPAARHVTVAVLNGTTVTGLAVAAAARLKRFGFREGVVTNDQTNQQRAHSAVYYEPGHKDAAVTVMRRLHLARAQVLPMDVNARVLADRAPIVVILGADAAR
jgi:lysylphosphatidylglycerol synthetase-like protein (DUF2156 family)